ncbi:MAG: ribonuclease III [Actinobacteria bacterium]|nr:ribonuclease III [Actinomycetota bacterium]MBV8478924.1 ribonuclease III [Actinomycetota bacterium]
MSTTSRRTSRAGELSRLIDALPRDAAATAFTHSSWAVERTASYERLEFLGDSVLELAVAHALYARYPEFSEGRLAKIRSHVVSRASCAVVANELGLGPKLGEFNEGEDVALLAKNRNVLAALLEAVLGALFLEHGFPAIEQAVVDAFSDRIEYALTTHVDHKTELQEALARLGRQVSYTVVEVQGPPHERTFTCAAVVDGEEIGRGEGRSKKAAEQEAAQRALVHLGSLAS